MLMIIASTMSFLTTVAEGGTQMFGSPIFLILQAAVAVSTPAPAPVPASTLPQWMAGCWTTQGAPMATEECWTAPRGGMMLGSSHTVDAQDTTRAFEHMRMVRDGEQIVFIAQPGGTAASRFPLLRSALRDGRPFLEFGNDAHDYPQRIRYWLEADGGLVGEISLADGSRPTRWAYQRR